MNNEIQNNNQNVNMQNNNGNNNQKVAIICMIALIGILIILVVLLLVKSMNKDNSSNNTDNNQVNDSNTDNNKEDSNTTNDNEKYSYSSIDEFKNDVGEENVRVVDIVDESLIKLDSLEKAKDFAKMLADTVNTTHKYELNDDWEYIDMIFNLLWDDDHYYLHTCISEDIMNKASYNLFGKTIDNPTKRGFLRVPNYYCSIPGGGGSSYMLVNNYLYDQDTNSITYRHEYEAEDINNKLIIDVSFNKSATDGLYKLTKIEQSVIDK